MRTRIKFCGMTRLEDVRVAAMAGADALGFIFAPGSSRQLEIAQFDALLLAVPALVTPVALFRDNARDDIVAVLSRSPRLVPQFHGDETPEFCASFARPWLKAVPMGALSDESLTRFLLEYSTSGCGGFVFDSHGGTTGGGTGRSFDWRRVPRDVSAPVILAGGLTPENVATAIQAVNPDAVDVSSGIESAPGIKDHAKMRRFAEEVFRARAD